MEECNALYSARECSRRERQKTSPPNGAVSLACNMQQGDSRKADCIDLLDLHCLDLDLPDREYGYDFDHLDFDFDFDRLGILAETFDHFDHFDHLDSCLHFCRLWTSLLLNLQEQIVD